LKPSKIVANKKIKLRLHGDIDDILTQARPLDTKSGIFVFNEKIDFSHDEDLEILVDFLDEEDNILGSFPIETSKYCQGKDLRIYAVEVFNNQKKTIGTFNIGAK